MSYETEYLMRDDHAECRAEIKRLEAINAELLAALEHIVQHQSAIAGNLAEFSGVVSIAKAAIANARPVE